MVPLALAAVFGGCAASKRHVIPRGQIRPALEATAAELIAKYNEQAGAVTTVNAGVELVPVAGSSYSGVIEEYHRVNGFVLVEKPAFIRVIGQAPVVGKNIFDMVSDGQTFSVFIPSKNKFIVGRAAFERLAKKPIENLRPQHLLDAFFWPEIDRRQQVLFEEFNTDTERYYILTVLRGVSAVEIVRKIWFDRADLSLARVQLYAPGGRLVSDIRYAEWQPVAMNTLGAQLGQAQPASPPQYPRHIWLARPHDDYQLEMRITKLAVNEEIAAERFKLEQPPGTELVRVGEGETGARP